MSYPTKPCPKCSKLIHIKYKLCWACHITPAPTRFWRQVNKNGPIPSHMPHLGNCWIYTGAKFNKLPYGHFKDGDGKDVTAHRFSWKLLFGDIPKGKNVLHHCDNPPCVRPDHLWLGSSQDNSDDRQKKGRQAKGFSLPFTKLSIQDRFAIIAARKAGESLAILAERYNVSDSLISLVATSKPPIF